MQMSPLIAVALVWAVVFLVGLEAMHRADRRRLVRTIDLMGETLGAEDWRVTGRRRGHPMTSYCVTRPEAEDARRHMRATGWRGVRVRRFA